MLLQTGAVLLAVVAALVHHGIHADDIGLYNGHASSISMAPFAGSVWYFDHYLCGGTLIHPQFVVTVAHCCHLGGQYQVGLGDSKIYTDHDAIHYYDVHKIVKHPDSYNDKNNYYVSLLKFNSSVELSTTVNVIPMYEGVDVPKGTFVWGWTEPKFNIDKLRPTLLELRYLRVELMHFDDCMRIYDNYNQTFKRDMFCARAGATQYDIGGAATATVSGSQEELVGVVATVEFPVQLPNGFLKLSPFVPWIKGVIENKF